MFKKILLYTLLFLAAFYITPFVTLVCGKKYRNACFRELYYQLVVDQLNVSNKNDGTTTILLYQFIKDNINVSGKSVSKKTNPCEVIIDGKGYCDEQANALITLAGECGIEGKLIFLYGSDSISHHAVCELKINDHFVMFDPFYGLVFFTNDHHLAGISDIQNNNIIKSNRLSIPTNYLKLFEKKYPSKVFRTNKISLPKKIIRAYLNMWHSKFGAMAIKPYFGIYFLLEGNNDLKERLLHQPSSICARS